MTSISAPTTYGIAVGSRIAHYDVTALIGEGGMGQVYQATDTKLNRQVALSMATESCTLWATENCTLWGESCRAAGTFSR